MNGFQKAMYMLPEHIRVCAEAYRDSPVEEIRLRVSHAPSLLISGREYELSSGELTVKDISRIIEKITGASLHAASQSMTEGYINYMGLRVGLCGRALIYKSDLRGFTDFSSLNIRIPREWKGICDTLAEEMYIKGFKNTLIISPPGLGKTTALRELIRLLSDKGIRIGAADDRNELSASDGGIAQFDLGLHTDTIVSAPKAQSAMMLLRAMNENIIAMDEISSPEDIEAIMQIFGCGVGILASAHASDRDELYRRPLYRKLINMKIFTYLVSIKMSAGKRTYVAERL